ncbi:hypothetical protein H0H92_006115 [Tricholoma furcatifolium]|nr:hypothetical protein H0H92_006115 [Tricholoma furcatifolium]
MALTKLRSLLRKPSKERKHTLEADAKKVMKDAILQLLDGIDFVRPNVKTGRLLALTRSLHSEFSAYTGGRDGDWFEKTCRTSAAFAVFSYPRHSHDVQAWIARYIWIGFYCDDFPTAKQNFLRCLIFSEMEGEPFKGFVTVMRGVYNYWDTIPASCIVAASADHINGSLLEDFQASRNMEISARAWPSYLRDKTGNASSMAFMVFPKDESYAVTDYIQAIKDIGIFIDRVNDVLTFYKEEMAEEKHNYVSMTARVEKKSTHTVLAEVSREAIDAYSRASSILQAQSPAAYEMWRAFALGHVYRLAELGL